jgi:sterol desaturase/sphingolipid hydroxylase (fatty acid hydroxylase superfamily)
MESLLSLLKRVGPVIGLSAFVIFLIWESVRPFFPFFAGTVRRRIVHGGRNLFVAILNVALVVVCFALLWDRAASWSHAGGFGLLHRTDLPLWLHATAAVLLLDVWTYWWHRANHRIGWLWRFHRMHHSDPWMDVTTARRFHPGEIALSSLLRVPLIGLLGVHPWELLVYQLAMGLVVDFHHANIALPPRVDRFLRVLFVTPAMHKVHHSQIQAETDSNYTSLLSVWDRIFGSFRVRTNLREICIGLDGWRAPRFQGVSAMLTTPMRPRNGPALPVAPKEGRHDP